MSATAPTSPKGATAQDKVVATAVDLVDLSASATLTRVQQDELPAKPRKRPVLSPWNTRGPTMRMLPASPRPRRRLVPRPRRGSVYSTSVAMLLTAVVSVFLFNFHLSLAFFLGSTVVSVSVYLHSIGKLQPQK
ncbi:CMP-sialic acid transporter 2 [Zea mays]|uniref:CMP-sialic acid transporter 2 n=1 Tax=Zea mays TaxID=4577 RepID=A0A3L6G693_MAIZE|nr:CMP-sialic acid transporter 2 [Zea mays]